MVSHHGVTLSIGGGAAAPGEEGHGILRMAAQVSVQDVAAGLHAAGLHAEEIAAVFEALEAAGAMSAEVIIR